MTKPAPKREFTVRNEEGAIVGRLRSYSAAAAVNAVKRRLLTDAANNKAVPTPTGLSALTAKLE